MFKVGDKFRLVVEPEDIDIHSRKTLHKGSTGIISKVLKEGFGLAYLAFGVFDDCKDEEFLVYDCVDVTGKFSKSIESIPEIEEDWPANEKIKETKYKPELKIVSNAGKQSADLAITNAIMIATQLSNETWKNGHKAISYALDWQLTYLEAAQKYLEEAKKIVSAGEKVENI